MSKSLAEVFKLENKVVKLPKHRGPNYRVQNGVATLIDHASDRFGDLIKKTIKKKIGIEVKKIPSGRDIVKSIENIRKNPLQALGNIVNDIINPKAPKNTDKKEKISERIEKESIKVPVNHNEGRPSGGSVGDRDRPDYGKLLGGVNASQDDGLTNKLICNITDDKKKEKEEGVEGSDDKKEFEKGRYPFKLPLSNEADKPVKIYDSKGSSGDTLDPSKSLVSNLQSTGLSEAKNSIKPNGIDGTGVLNRTAAVDTNSKLWNRLKNDYFIYNDPYDSSVQPQGFNSFSEAVEDLRSRGLLSSYKDFAGFEMGSDHMWKIRILPYPYDQEDVAVFNSLGRTSVVPPLPCYTLPNMWKESDKSDSSIKGYANGLIRKHTDITPNRLSINVPHGSPGLTGVYSSISGGPSTSNGATVFSFSHNPPVLSYDITVGAIRADSLRLFNGSSAEVMAGMSYNAMMSISILDDVYGSMKKYMATFINSAYDIVTNSMAPYYAIAFQLELIILRAGGQINYHHKFIGVPTEYTIRHSGSQDTTEEGRVDLTFGIIGYKTPKLGLDRNVYPGQMGGRAKQKTDDGLEKNFSLGNLTWRDITLKMGQDVNY